MKKQLLIILVLLFSSCKKQNYHKEIKRISSNKISFRKGTLTQSYNFPVINVKGSPYQAGLQYGVLLKERIHDIFYQLDKQVGKKVGHSKLKKILAHLSFWFKIKKIRWKLDQSFLDELDGITDGSGLTSFQMDTIAFFPQIFFDINCTSLVIKKGKKIIHGRNLDWGGIRFLAPFAIITHYEIDGELPYLNLSYIGYPGLYTGLNSKGLSLAVNMNGSTSDENHYDKEIPIPYQTRKILAKAGTLDETRKILSTYKTHAWFLTIASAIDNQASIFELVRGKIFENSMNNGLISITNLGLSDMVKNKYSPINEHNDSNYSRMSKINKILDGNKSNTLLERTFQVLRDYSWNHLKRTPLINHSLNNKRTVQSIIFENLDKKIHFSFSDHHAAGKQFLQYDMNNNKIAKSKMALPFFQSNKYKKIVECYDKKNDCQDQTLLKLKQINDLIKDKNFTKALSLTKQFETAFPKFYQPYQLKANIYKKSKKYNKAIVSLKELIALTTTSPYEQYKSYLELARIYHLFQKPLKAMANLKKARNLASQFYLDAKRKTDLNNIETLISSPQSI